MKTWLLLTLLVTGLLCGCETPNRTAYRTLGSIAITVDTAVSSYYTYRDAGHYDAKLDAKIKDSYLHYQDLMKVAQKAQQSLGNGTLEKSVWDKTFNAVSVSASEIVGAIRNFLPKETK